MQASSGKYKKKLRPCGVKAEGCSSEALSVLHNLAQTPSRTQSTDTIQDTEHRHHLGHRAETPSRTQSTDTIQDREQRHHLGHRAQTPSRTQSTETIQDREQRHHLGHRAQTPSRTRAETPSRTQSKDAIQDREHRHHLGHRAQTPSRTQTPSKTQTWKAIVGRLLPELHVDQGEIKRIHPMLKYSNNRKSMSYHIFTFSNNKSGSFSDAVKSSCQFSISIQISMS